MSIIGDLHEEWAEEAAQRHAEEIRILKVEIAQLKLEKQQLEDRNRVLAAELTSEILTAQDREGVVKGLTRKV